MHVCLVSVEYSCIFLSMSENKNYSYLRRLKGNIANLQWFWRFWHCLFCAFNGSLEKIAMLWFISPEVFYHIHIDGYLSCKTVSGIFCLWQTDPMASLFPVRGQTYLHLLTSSACRLFILHFNKNRRHGFGGHYTRISLIGTWIS